MENQSKDKPFGIRDKFGYMLGDFGCNMSFVFINNFMLLYYVTCLGIPGKIYSILILIAKILDKMGQSAAAYFQRYNVYLYSECSPMGKMHSMSWIIYDMVYCLYKC